MPRVSKENAKLDKEWRTSVIERDGFCQVCGPEKINKVLNAHHLIPREFREWRWELSNGMILCVHHHTLGKLSAHKHPLWFIAWLRKYRRAVLMLMMERTREFV